ncbi:hypothetical protein P153DRAFT_321336 [Dothidotthia symphoricarpi CBS 119687]|uniref:DUF3632 domain containing protein n=1 Tax=Dothidotthia symphoricarpi CBS 119687 TaxID=1392245 RepID=A0A6A6A4F8_9PLEO|nr:uncharacterized protein P153DRAFT_321336 [Dothidotthia symphoricarpi CBS 119687]KAF2126690.1 hypothetical protein P153DRAFT_321336 [Dothidotthia symphoricarpi CBS 119687]
MNHPLLSTSPKGLTELPSSESATIDAQDVRECAARGEFEEMRGAAFYNRTWIVTERYSIVGDGVDSLEKHLHSLWHMYYQLGLHTSHESSAQDSLVLDILRIQGKGPLTRTVRGSYGIDIARTADGTLWNDLPFLVTDMTTFWINSCASMSGVQRLNFSTFLAKLASTRVSKDRMCRIALILFRSTFEEPRPVSTTDMDDTNTHRTTRGLDMIHLLPAACAWIKVAGHNIIQLSDVSWNDFPSAIGQGGEFFVESELGKRSSAGFTPWRWMYWLKRLHEIREEAKEANEKRVEEHASEAIDLMVQGVRGHNSGILRAYQNGGNVVQEDKHLVCLRGEDSI